MTMNEPRPIAGLTPHVNVDGARKAIDFYKAAFAATEHDVRIAEGSNRLLHAQLDINGSSVFLCDFFPDYGFPPVTPQAFNLHLQVDDAQAWWDRAVGAGCTVVSPLKTEFWGDLYGRLKDPFGVDWCIGQSQLEQG
jgi:PhnB protein